MGHAAAEGSGLREMQVGNHVTGALPVPKVSGPVHGLRLLVPVSISGVGAQGPPLIHHRLGAWSPGRGR